MSFKNSFQKLYEHESQCKGENGVIIVIGGSYIYTGAPIFCAKASLRSGSDLVYIFTDEKAMSSIKSFYEAIVLPLELNLKILEKATACVIGPGLGVITEEKFDVVLKISEFINKRNIPIILDADSIHLYKKGVFKNFNKIILTPNHNEAKNLILENRHICIFKNKIDSIVYNGKVTIVDDKSSLKRCCGQGDILSGILATAVSLDPNDLVKACASACQVTRRSSYLAFQEKGFSLIANDILDVMHLILKKYDKKNN